MSPTAACAAQGAHEFESGARCGRGGGDNGDDLDCGGGSCIADRLHGNNDGCRGRASSSLGARQRSGRRTKTISVSESNALKALKRTAAHLLSNLGARWQKRQRSVSGNCLEGRSTTVARKPRTIAIDVGRRPPLTDPVAIASPCGVGRWRGGCCIPTARTLPPDRRVLPRRRNGFGNAHRGRRPRRAAFSHIGAASQRRNEIPLLDGGVCVRSPLSEKRATCCLTKQQRSREATRTRATNKMPALGTSPEAGESPHVVCVSIMAVCDTGVSHPVRLDSCRPLSIERRTPESRSSFRRPRIVVVVEQETFAKVRTRASRIRSPRVREK
jgi:hypothetical protein